MREIVPHKRLSVGFTINDNDFQKMQRFDSSDLFLYKAELLNQQTFYTNNPFLLPQYQRPSYIIMSRNKE